jgi:hypothetical protein
MEDRAHIVSVLSPNQDVRYALYCVLDGHGGEVAVNLAQKHIAHFTTSSPLWAKGKLCLSVVFFHFHRKFFVYFILFYFNLI